MTRCDGDPDLGLEPDEPGDAGRRVIRPCGCAVHPADLHDEETCREDQADERAYWDDLRGGGLWPGA